MMLLAEAIFGKLLHVSINKYFFHLRLANKDSFIEVGQILLGQILLGQILLGQMLPGLMCRDLLIIFVSNSTKVVLGF